MHKVNIPWPDYYPQTLESANNGYGLIMKQPRYFVIPMPGVKDMYYTVFRTKEELNIHLSKLDNEGLLDAVIVVEGNELPVKKSYV